MKASVLAASVAVLQCFAVAYAQDEGQEAAPAMNETDQEAGAQPAAAAHAAVQGERIPPPRDIDYPAPLTLKVDVTDLERRVFAVHESIPVRPGPLTLLYPEWLPGNHAPRGPIDSLAGLRITAGGRPLEWVRDPVNMYAFHVAVPANSSRLDLEFQFASPLLREQGRTVATPDILGLQWNTVVLYPAGYFSRRIIISPSLTLPEDWQFAAALEVSARRGNEVQFKPTSLEMLVDSPVFAGRYFSSVELDPGARVPVRLNLVADSADSLDFKAAQIEAHRRLVHEAYALFGPPHYDRYDFLLALSEHFGEIGLEHHRSSENRRLPGYFLEWDKSPAGRDLLPHEFSHSWNGKFRRPAGLATPDFNTPMRDSLLWVYEGLTNYTGFVLAARSALWSGEIARQAWASAAASMDRDRAGRLWRDLQDTTDQPIITARRPLSWLSWQRTEDYYTEGQLLWLDVDTRIRELTAEKRSLDDFAHAFFSIDPGQLGPHTYTLEDVVQALHSVVAFDWAGYFRERLHSHGPGAPLDGLTRGGWTLAYADAPGEFTRSSDEQHHLADFMYSLGFSVSTQSSQLIEVRWGGPAYDAGLAIGTLLVAVNGREYKPELLKTALKLAKANRVPIELLVKNIDRFRTVRIPYYDGPRYPQLQRVSGTPDRLSAIMKPRAGGG